MKDRILWGAVGIGAFVLALAVLGLSRQIRDLRAEVET
jgi:hypothetical protein